MFNWFKTLFILFLLLLTPLLQAQKPIKGLGRSAKKSFIRHPILTEDPSVDLRLLWNTLKKSSRSYWNQVKTLQLLQQVPMSLSDQMAGGSVFLDASTERDLNFSITNDQIALDWLQVSARDLRVLRSQKARIFNLLRSDIVLPTYNYAALIPPEASYIAVGEVHGHKELRKNFVDIVLQYQKLHPERRIIILTEFLSDRGFSSVTGEPVPLEDIPHRVSTDDFYFLSIFPRKGIELIGLEDWGFMYRHQHMISPSFSQAESVYGLKKRNEHWVKIINKVRQKNPEAVFFIYTGGMHVLYHAPFTLSRASGHFFVIQQFADNIGGEIPFGEAMKDTPFVESGRRGKVISWKGNTPFRQVSGFDAAVLLPSFVR